MSRRYFKCIAMGCAVIGAALMMVYLLHSPSISAQQVDRPIVIKNVRVFTGTKVISASTVVIENGKIKSIGKTVTIPDGAEVIDGTGQTLLPGLIDAHTHTFGDGLKRALMFGVTTHLDMFSDHRMATQMRKEQEEGGANDRADLFSAGTLVTAPGGHGTQFGMSIPTITAANEAQAYVDARIGEGSDYIKIVYEDGKTLDRKIPTINKEVMTAVIAASHNRGKLAVVHITSADAARDAIMAGADGLVHIYNDQPSQSGFASLVASKHAFIIPTLSVLESLTGFAGGATLIIDSGLANALSPTDAVALKSTFPMKSNSQSSYSNAEEAVQQLKVAGVTILAGTDAPNPGTLYGASIHRELELLVKAGLTPVEALTAATSASAIQFKLNDRGVIEPGKRADLLLVKGDPTIDIKATRNITKIWKGGIPVNRNAYIASIQKMKDESEQLRSQPAPAGSESGLVSDFDQEKISAKFGSGWAISTDVIIGGKSKAEMKIASEGAHGSSGSLSINGDISAGSPYPWAGAMFSPGAIAMAPANLSSKKEISFWAKGDGKTYRLMLFAKKLGYQPAIKSFVAGPEWKQVKFLISDFNGIDGSDLMGILFTGGPSIESFAFQIDDVVLN